MTEEELQAIRERAERATVGDWDYDVEDGGISNGNFMVAMADSNAEGYPYIRAKECDLEFIAASREDIPKLLAEVEWLTNRLNEAENLMSEAHDLLDNVHCYETDVYNAISKYFNDEEDDE
ncbi:hypothetical protein [Mesobacillus zeae]|uniref:Uncharacterized protein n=1 Tax=Mesobacillus zeae TaxID=1917180 RepID=A0A398BKH3_9BACI|nr:hypothetical protein [Mesobacillus zeae]RID89008.1 hypothetical protein D1970_00460 [Mesobacillus zeae]